MFLPSNNLSLQFSGMLKQTHLQVPGLQNDQQLKQTHLSFYKPYGTYSRNNRLQLDFYRICFKNSPCCLQGLSNLFSKRKEIFF